VFKLFKLSGVPEALNPDFTVPGCVVDWRRRASSLHKCNGKVVECYHRKHRAVPITIVWRKKKLSRLLDSFMRI